jgi:hypothetical protein
MQSDKASAEEVLRYCLDGGQPGTSRQLHNALSTHSPHDAVLCWPGEVPKKTCRHTVRERTHINYVSSPTYDIARAVANGVVATAGVGYSKIV